MPKVQIHMTPQVPNCLTVFQALPKLQLPSPLSARITEPSTDDGGNDNHDDKDFNFDDNVDENCQQKKHTIIFRWCY